MEPIQIEFDFMQDAPALVPAPTPASDPIKALAVMVTMIEAKCTGAAAQKCPTGSVAACPGSPREGPARGAMRPPRGWRRPARGRGLWAHGVKRGVIRTVAGVVTGSA